MGIVGTILALVGFGWGMSIGLGIGYFLFIYMQPAEVQVMFLYRVYSVFVTYDGCMNSFGFRVYGVGELGVMGLKECVLVLLLLHLVFFWREGLCCRYST